MLRITLIAGTYQPDRCGVAHYTARLRETLSQHNIQSTVLTTQAAAQTVRDPNVRGVVSNWGFTDLFPLVRAVLSTPSSLLHIQHAAGTYRFQRAIFFFPLLLRAWGYRQPIVTTVHEYGWWEWEPSFVPLRFLEWFKTWGQNRELWDREDGFLLTQSQSIITTNAEVEAAIRERLPGLVNRVYRIPIGANVEVFPLAYNRARQNLSQQYGWSLDSVVLAFFGFLHPVKGIENLLAAFEQVIAQFPRSRLLLVGGVESLALPAQQAQNYWDKLQALIKKLNLEAQVKMTGYVSAESASHYLAGADIGVLPFHHGVTLKSGSLLTLFAHGLPVVATESPARDRQLQDRDSLYLVPPRNVETLTAALCRLIADRQLRDRLSHSGRAFVQRFSWSAIGNAHCQIYRQHLTGK